MQQRPVRPVPKVSSHKSTKPMKASAIAPIVNGQCSACWGEGVIESGEGVWRTCAHCAARDEQAGGGASDVR